MNTYRKTAVIVGILFIIGTASGILSGVITAPISIGTTFPHNIAASETQWIAGTLLVALMGLSLAMMPVMLYPIRILSIIRGNGGHRPPTSLLSGGLRPHRHQAKPPGPAAGRAG